MLKEAERESWHPLLSKVWSQKKPKQHYRVYNELDLLLELEAAPLQQLGTVAGKCGEEQSTAAQGGWGCGRTQGALVLVSSHLAGKPSPNKSKCLGFSVPQ